ncbi:response regulator transcription factor [Streptomyces sp. NPDC059255]|uniref:response regulator transcription factor n=1 Tax=Streptomyces sp. NPDC059255 TaxID=3346793 RepID=UPI003680DE30
MTTMQLSTRQMEILLLIAEGYRDKQIAERLGMSVRTVDSHLQRLYDRYGVRSRAAIVAKWLLEGGTRGSSQLGASLLLEACACDQRRRRQCGEGRREHEGEPVAGGGLAEGQRPLR